MRKKLAAVALALFSAPVHSALVFEFYGTMYQISYQASTLRQLSYQPYFFHAYGNCTLGCSNYSTPTLVDLRPEFGLGANWRFWSSEAIAYGDVTKTYTGYGNAYTGFYAGNDVTWLYAYEIDRFRSWDDGTQLGTGFGYPEFLATKAMPEPSTWAMLIAGFALVGGAFRRDTARRPRISAATF